MVFLHNKTVQQLAGKLNKGPQITAHAAIFLVFLAAYCSGSITTLQGYGMTKSVLSALGLVYLAVIVYGTIVFLVSRLVRRMDIVDIAWSGGFAVAGLAAWGLNSSNLVIGANVQTLVMTLVFIWALRLSYHIVRRVLSHGEDKRYVALRKKWKGSEALNAYVRIFFVQSVLATTISMAIIHANFSEPTPLGWLAYVGVAVWLVGFFFQAVGDWQLKQFLAAKKRAAILTTGLWRYTRHPNYFGEATMWWGIFIIVLSTQFGWVGILSPILITYLLLFVSGVPLTEKAFEGRKGWKAYKARTSMFLPLPPK